MDEHDREVPAMVEPELKREFRTSIGEHETLIGWNSDVHAEMFQDWWSTKGFKLFSDWAQKNAGIYRV